LSLWNSILVVEDDLLLAETLQDLLEEEGYSVQHAINGEEALEILYKEKFSLYLLDINLPLIDGITLLKELRQANDETPTIFLTSHQEKEKLQEGFLSGGDDYITKPFDTDELLLRIEAILRRNGMKLEQQIGHFCINEKNMKITYKSIPLELSKKEYILLRLLLSNANEIVLKETIIDELWSISQKSSEGAIRVYINRLKQLLPEIVIENIRGMGYKLVL